MMYKIIHEPTGRIIVANIKTKREAITLMRDLNKQAETDKCSKKDCYVIRMQE